MVESHQGSRHTRRVITVALMALLLASAAAWAQTSPAYPAKPIRLIVPFTAGGPTDILARVIGQKLNETFGPQVIVDNRPGANGNIGTELVAKSPPDGYTLLLASAGILTVNPSLHSRLPFDVTRDLAPVTLATSITNVLVVHPALPVKSVQDFIRLAQSRPGQLSYASAGTGSASHLAMELLKSTARVDILHVPYKGATPGITDLMGGHVQVMLIGLPGALPPVSAGRLKALAVSSLRRSPAVPELPTIAESRLPGFEVINWLGVLAPAGTPRDIITKLNQEIVKGLQQPDTKAKLVSQGFETMGGTPEQFAAYMKSETAKWAKVVKATGAKAD
ncbi:MAG: tripartite tricarboxylate transporter substrate binding protein [Betaproteobacteria bacterium]|nr:tripartite tricarboxylate transporter substrate binding protein [Betaproteobacteria bacterium]MBI3054801.1 tripartite tricarboxylate transporter substrate binding protein [Betaproteobacteria bacterium]